MSKIYLPVVLFSKHSCMLSIPKGDNSILLFPLNGLFPNTRKINRLCHQPCQSLNNLSYVTCSLKQFLKQYFK